MTTRVFNFSRKCFEVLLILLPLAVPSTLLAQSDSPRRISVPNPDEGADTLAARGKAQIESMSTSKVFHDFRFSDQVKESGITFFQHPVADALQNFTVTHYDHGNAVAVGDVDGDGVGDILFTNELGGNELFKNIGGGKFKSITAESGIALPGKISIGAAFADIDNDGDQDLMITTIRGGDHLFENDGRGRFKDITKDAGVDVQAHSISPMFFDYDRDGLLDLLICNVGRYTTDVIGPDGTYVAMRDAVSGHRFPERYEHSVIYKNMGGNKFKDVTASLGVQPSMWNGDVSFGDVNGDGWPDLYFMNMQGDDHYFENQGGKSFVEKTKQVFPMTPWGSMGIKFFDYDNDGRMDLLITDMHSDMSHDVTTDQEKLKSEMRMSAAYLMTMGTSIYGNALYHNVGNGKFEEVSDRLGAETFWPWGISVADINADGWEDVFVTGGMGFPFRYGINSLLLNNRGVKFLDSEFVLGIEPRRDVRTHSLSFEIDCSKPFTGVGKEACVGQTDKVQIWGTLSSRSSVIFDLDNDGDLDIVTNDFNKEPMVLVSDRATRKPMNWLKVVLVGSKSNRNGLGATVRVYSRDQTYTKSNDGKSGYQAQSVLPLYFGLGAATAIDRVEVDWPSGRKQVVNKKQIGNRSITIAEPK